MAAKPKGIFGLGAGVTLENDNDGRSQESRLPLQFALGARWEPWATRLEYSSFGTTDGNNTVSVARERQSVYLFVNRTLFFTGQDHSSTNDFSWRPYIEAGFGTSRIKTESRFGAIRENTIGDWRAVAAAGAGVLSHWSESFSVSSGLRWESGELVSLADARWGLTFMAEIAF